MTCHRLLVNTEIRSLFFFSGGGGKVSGEKPGT